MTDPGAKLGRYELRDLIGSGGMATVYKGYDPLLDREIAIKVLPPELARKEILRKRFREEARALGRVDHPSVIRIYAVDQQGPITYYAMELVKGMSLMEAMQYRGPFSVTETMAVFSQFLNGLQAIHQAGIIHRDLKPGNIMLSELGRAIVMDFGLARRAERQAVTSAGAVLGTPEYMSPEQARGEVAGVRSDLYSSGIVLYEMLAGTPPFAGKDTLSIMRKHVEACPPSILKKAANIPECIENVLERLLAKKPDTRFDDAATLISALGSFMQDSHRTEQTVRQIVGSARKAQTKRTRVFSRKPSGASSEKDRASAALQASQTRQRPSWVPWGAMAAAILAVVVALLALLQPPANAGDIWWKVNLRTGGTVVGRIDRWEELDNGDASVILVTREGEEMPLLASEIQRAVQRQDRSFLRLAALLVALVVLGFTLTVLFQSRRRVARPRE